jgi:hypothetical protein
MLKDKNTPSTPIELMNFIETFIIRYRDTNLKMDTTSWTPYSKIKPSLGGSLILELGYQSKNDSVISNALAQVGDSITCGAGGGLADYLNFIYDKKYDAFNNIKYISSKFMVSETMYKIILNNLKKIKRQILIQEEKNYFYKIICYFKKLWYICINK